MKFRRLAIALFVPFFIACTIGVTAWQREHSLLYASPETESTFLKSYTPKPVIDRFRENKGFSGGGGIGGGAGHSFVTHQGHFQFHVVLRRENWLPLMNALRDDVLRQLVDNDAEVLSQSGNPSGALRFDYRVDQSIGSLIIWPLAMNSHVQRNTPLPEGMDDVTIKIEQTEKWFPKGLGATQASPTGFVPK